MLKFHTHVTLLDEANSRQYINKCLLNRNKTFKKCIIKKNVKILIRF